MRKCSRKLCNEKANREFCSGYCELSHPLEEEIAELKAKITEVIPVIQTIYNEDYGSQISDDLFNVLQILESSEVKK